MTQNEINKLLDEKYEEFNNTAFIIDDPISIPHLFTRKEDVEISAFFAAILAWGQRTQIILNADKLMQIMDYSPYQFITTATKEDLGSFQNFVYRTFNGTDCVFFIRSLQKIYNKHDGLEKVFTDAYKKYGSIKMAISVFRKIFFSTPHLRHSEKHISDPIKNSACKRLNLFLRWMVRQDNRGVDFGLWKGIPPSALYCPLDVHTGETSRELGLLSIKQNNWKAVEELTCKLRKFDPVDPVKYDFSLFGLGFIK